MSLYIIIVQKSETDPICMKNQEIPPDFLKAAQQNRLLSLA